jgi:ribosomal protein S6
VEKLTETELKEAKTYEIGYLLTPFLPADKVDETVEAMYKTLIEDLDGLMIIKTTPKMRALSYPVSKFISNKRSTFSEAYFGAVKFQISPEKIRTIKEQLEKDNNVVRFLIVNIPKNSERVVVPAGIATKKFPTDAKEEGAEKGEEMSDEEIDKEIEGLLETQAS